MTDTPTVRLQRVAPGVWLKLETRSPNATHADRIAAHVARGLQLPAGSTLREAVDGSLCVALAMQCVQRGWQLEAWVGEELPIEARYALQAYGAKVTRAAGSPDAVLAAARAGGPLARDLQPLAARQAAEEVGRELSDLGIAAVVAEGALLEGVAAVLGARAVEGGRGVGFEQAWQLRARLGREEGLLVSVATAAWVGTAAAMAAELGPGRRVLTIATDTGERDFSRQPGGSAKVAAVLGA